jgi:TonB family protein
MPFLSSSKLPIAFAFAFVLTAAVIGHPAPAAPAAPAAADAADDLAKLLARPMTPGSVALLVEHVSQQAAQKRLIEAAKHEDPAVRAVAARIAFVTESRGLASPLIAMVAKEENTQTAVEQIRALSGMLGAPVDNVVMRHVERIGGPTAVVMAELLARTRPQDLVKHLPALLAAAGEYDSLGGPIGAAIVQHPAAANDILQAVLATKNEKLWGALLASVRENTAGSIPSDVLLQALKSDQEYQRTAVVWHLLYAVEDGDPTPEEAVAAAAPKPSAAGAAASDLTWEDFGRELLARARGAAPTKADWIGMMTLDKHKERVRRVAGDILSYLSPEEQKALAAARGFDTGEQPRRRGREKEKKRATDGRSRTQVMRTIPVFAKGLLGDLLEVTGCRPNESQLSVGEVTYHPEGGPKRISVIQAPMSKGCEQFVHTMMKLTIALAERPITPEFADRIVLLFNRQYLACADDPFPPVRPRFRPDSTIVPPQRIKRAEIQYPRAAQRAGIDGSVRLGVRISHTGCIGAAETLRSAEPVLDLAAIQGVFTAKYSPTLLDGQPVETVMTYTVTFANP